MEVAQFNTGIALRDSKAPDAGYLRLSSESFATLITQVKGAELGL